MYSYLLARTDLSPQVITLIMLAHGLDTTQDQPYMPFPQTTLMEAIQYLRHNRNICIQGGRITLPVRGGVRLTYNNRSFHITWRECLWLLRANYSRPGQLTSLAKFAA